MAAPTTDQQSAKAIITATLAEYGLESLAETAWQAYLAGTPMEQVMLDIRKTPQYKTRFAGMEALQKKGRAITEGEYISIEKQYVSMFRQAGLPAGFYDSPDDFAGFISNEVSPQEMGARLDVARVALYETPPVVREQLASLYGLGSGDVMAFLLDPVKALPVLKQQFAAAEAAGASSLSGYGMLSRLEAENVALSGRTFDQFSQGFDDLAKSTELFQPIMGEGSQDSINRDEQLGAVFGGNTSARRRLEKRAKERAAAFQGGGGFARTQGGSTGLGSAAN